MSPQQHVCVYVSPAVHLWANTDLEQVIFLCACLPVFALHVQCFATLAQVLHQRFLKLLHVGPAPTAGMAASLSTAATWMGSYEGTPAQTRPFHQRDSHAQADMLVLHCLRRLALIRCDSSMQLLAALLALRQGTWQVRTADPHWTHWCDQWRPTLR